MDRPHRSDRSTRGLVRLRDLTAARRHQQDPESGQAMVEFALILFPLLILVVGIIQFGIGLNYWLDMNRLANQGARWAAVNNWPAQCPRNDAPTYNCNSSTASTPCATVFATNSQARLRDVLRCQTRTTVNLSLCYPGQTPANATIGEPVKVKLTAPYTFFFIDKVSVTLTATATMRLERVPMSSLKTGAGGRHVRSSRPRRHSERGQVVILFALLLPVILTIGSIVVSAGNWYVLKRHLQTQVDSAAFAGAQEFTGCLSSRRRISRSPKAR